MKDHEDPGYYENGVSCLVTLFKAIGGPATTPLSLSYELGGGG